MQRMLAKASVEPVPCQSSQSSNTGSVPALSSQHTMLEFLSPVQTQGLTVVEGVSKDSESRHERHLPGTSAGLLLGMPCCLFVASELPLGPLPWVLRSPLMDCLSKAEGWSAFLIRLHSA